MKLKLLLIAGLLLSGCAQVASSAKAICEIEKPTFTIEEVESLSDRTLYSVDNFFTKFDAGCDSL